MVAGSRVAGSSYLARPPKEANGWFLEPRSAFLDDRLELIELSRLFVDLVLDFDLLLSLLDFFDRPVLWIVCSNSGPVLIFRMFGGSRVPAELALEAARSPSLFKSRR